MNLDYLKSPGSSRRVFLHEKNAVQYLNEDAPQAVRMACVQCQVCTHDGILKIAMEEGERDLWELFAEFTLTIRETVQICIAAFRLLSCIQGYAHHGDCKADNIVLIKCAQKPEGCVYILFRSEYYKIAFIDFETLYTFESACTKLDASYYGTVSGCGFYGRRPLENMRKTSPAIIHQSDVYTLVSSLLLFCIPNQPKYREIRDILYGYINFTILEVTDTRPRFLGDKYNLYVHDNTCDYKFADARSIAEDLTRHFAGSL